MTKKSPSPILIGSLALVLSLACSNTDVYAAPTNKVPTVTAFSVPENSPSPVPVLTFAAADSDGTVTGYLITESASKPSATASGWSTTPPTQYATPSVGAVTLYAWAKDNKSAVSDSAADTVTIPPPPLNADTLDGLHAVAFAPAVHAHASSDITGLAAALANKADVAHNHDTVYLKKYANVIVVAKSGGDFTDPVAAVNSITDASATNPYLVTVMPGAYNIGSTGVAMKPYVDLEGSGENMTTITGNANGMQAVVLCASNSEVRDITVEAIGTGPSMACAIYLENLNEARITRTTAIANGPAGNTAVAIYTALNWTGSNTVIMKDVTARAVNPVSGSNVGIVVSQGFTAILRDVNVEVADSNNVWGLSVTGSAMMKNVTVSASNGYQPFYTIGLKMAQPGNVTMDGCSLTSSGLGIDLGASAKINHSRVSGQWNAISIGMSGGAWMADTLLNGTILKDPLYGSIKCLGVYDDNYEPVTCP